MATKGLELIFSANDNGAFKRKFVRDGVQGNYDVVFEMIRITRNTVNYNRSFEKVVKDLLINRGLDSYSDSESIFNTIYDYVHKNIKYILDSAGKVDNIKSAVDTLSDGFGDCDDLAILCASMLGVLGFEDVRFVMARYNELEPSFVHIYTVCYDKGERFVFDTTLPNGKLNDEVKAFEKKEIAVFNEIEGVTSLSGFMYNLKRTFQGVGKTAIRAIPTATQFLPVGFFSGAALATGATILTQNAEQKLSFNETGSKINRQLDKIILDLCNHKIAYDLAKNYAAQIASQIAVIDKNTIDGETYKTVKNSIQSKLNFIGNFNEYAEKNNLQVVNLDSRKMLLASLAGLGFGGYAVYKALKKN